MEMFITEESIIRSIQREFREKWPHLKLEFYRNPCRGDQENEQLPADMPIDDIRNIHTSAWVDVSGHIPVKALENQFFRLLGLNVRVFRKSGGLWLETTATSHQTLAEHEEAACAACS